MTLTHEGIAWPPPVYSVNQLLAAKSTKKHCTTTKTAKTTKTAQSLTPSQGIELQNAHVIKLHAYMKSVKTGVYCTQYK